MFDFICRFFGWKSEPKKPDLNTYNFQCGTCKKPVLAIKGRPEKLKQPSVVPKIYCTFQCMWCGMRMGGNNVSDCPNCLASHWTVINVYDREKDQWLYDQVERGS